MLLREREAILSKSEAISGEREKKKKIGQDLKKKVFVKICAPKSHKTILFMVKMTKIKINLFN